MLFMAREKRVVVIQFKVKRATQSCSSQKGPIETDSVNFRRITKALNASALSFRNWVLAERLQIV